MFFGVNDLGFIGPCQIMASIPFQIALRAVAEPLDLVIMCILSLRSRLAMISYDLWGILDRISDGNIGSD